VKLLAGVQNQSANSFRMIVSNILLTVVQQSHLIVCLSVSN